MLILLETLIHQVKLHLERMSYQLDKLMKIAKLPAEYLSNADVAAWQQLHINS